MWSYRLPKPGEYQSATIHERPAWLAFPDSDACYGYWEENAFFTWLRQPVEKGAQPLNLDLEDLDESPSVVKLEKATNWEAKAAMDIRSFSKKCFVE